jgi:DNA processing protein
MGALAERVSGPVRRRDLLGPAVSRVLDAVPVRRPAPAERIARTAGIRLDAVVAALAALAAHDLVGQTAEGYSMTILGRGERRAGRPDPQEELPLAGF